MGFVPALINIKADSSFKTHLTHVGSSSNASLVIRPDYPCLSFSQYEANSVRSLRLKGFERCGPSPCNAPQTLGRLQTHLWDTDTFFMGSLIRFFVSYLFVYFKT